MHYKKILYVDSYNIFFVNIIRFIYNLTFYVKYDIIKMLKNTILTLIRGNKNEKKKKFEGVKKSL